MRRLPQSELWSRIFQLAAVLLSLLSFVSPMRLRAQQPPLNASSRVDAALRLSPGDLIELSVYNVPDLNTKVRIGSNGDVYLPLIDYVHLGGLTAEEAQSLIQKRLSDEGF